MKTVMTLVVAVTMLLGYGVASAWDGVYKQVEVSPQEARQVGQHVYYGRNPTEDRFWIVQGFGEGLAMESLKANGTTWEAFYGVPDGAWTEMDQVVSSETYSANGFLEEISPTELVWYVYWCNPGVKTLDAYVPLGRRDNTSSGLYRKVSERMQTGCYVPSRNYIRLEKVN